MKIIVINGTPGAGKDLFVKFAQWNFDEIYNISTVDYVKSIASQTGWNGIKDERGRKYLSDLKDVMTEYDDIPFKKVVEHMNKILYRYYQWDMLTDNLFFFVHCREPEEIQKWVDRYNAKTLLIRRPAVEVAHDNHADSNVFDFSYDFCYYNIYGKDKMEADVIGMMEMWRGMDWKCGGEGLNIWDYTAERRII